jgi:methionyl-tRNA formyltransferase
MKYVFFGTPDLAARFLERVMASGFVPCAVVTNPDRPIGRKQVLTPPPVKLATGNWQLATGKNGGGDEEITEKIEILQPEKLDAEFVAKLKAYGADFFVVFAYGKILRKNVLELPRLGCIGVHPSLLPKYRGPTPFQSALLNGETETGVTLFLLDEGVDSGPILARSAPVPITDKDTYRSLAEKLADAGADLFISIVPKLLEGKLEPQPQDDAQATFTKKFTSEDAYIVPEDLVAAQNGDGAKASAIDRKIRALNPEPGVWILQNGKRVKLLEAVILNGALKLRKTQEEGQKPKYISS